MWNSRGSVAPEPDGLAGAQHQPPSPFATKNGSTATDISSSSLAGAVAVERDISVSPAASRSRAAAMPGVVVAGRRAQAFLLEIVEGRVRLRNARRRDEDQPLLARRFRIELHLQDGGDLGLAELDTVVGAVGRPDRRDREILSDQQDGHVDRLLAGIDHADRKDVAIVERRCDRRQRPARRNPRHPAGRRRLRAVPGRLRAIIRPVSRPIGEAISAAPSRCSASALAMRRDRLGDRRLGRLGIVGQRQPRRRSRSVAVDEAAFRREGELAVDQSDRDVVAAGLERDTRRKGLRWRPPH